MDGVDDGVFGFFSSSGVVTSMEDKRSGENVESKVTCGHTNSG